MPWKKGGHGLLLPVRRSEEVVQEVASQECPLCAPIIPSALMTKGRAVSAPAPQVLSSHDRRRTLAHSLQQTWGMAAWMATQYP